MKKIISLLLMLVILSSVASALSFKQVLVNDVRGGQEVMLSIKDNYKKNTKILVVMPELNLYKRLGPINTKTSLMSKTVFFETPQNIKPDFYLLRISARNSDGERKVVNRLVWME